MVEGAAGKHGVTAADECFKLVVKWNGKKLDFELPAESATVGDVRKVLEAQTCVPCKRQKLVGLGKQPNPEDSVLLGALNLKNFQCSFMMIGAPDEAMMLQVSEIDDMPEVINDLDQDFAYDDEMTAALIANAENEHKLREATEKAEINIMNPPRPGKNLLVLDLDHTLLDYKDRRANKRPHCIEFLRAVYPYYDLCVWSQTKWMHIEQKLIDLGIVSLSGASDDVKITFVLDRTAMFKIKSHRKTKQGKAWEHEVKPLELIWRKEELKPFYNRRNTVHIDDLSRNFAMNPQQGLRITKFSVADQRPEDGDLVHLEKYLVYIAKKTTDFSDLKHSEWKSTLAQIEETPES